MADQGQVKAFHDSIMHENHAQTRFMVMKGVDVDSLNSENETALIWSVKNKNVAGVDLLLALGAAPTTKDQEGTTVLQLAVKNEMLKETELLLMCGAYQVIDERDTGGKTALFHATQLEHEELVQTLINFNATPNHSLFDDEEGGAGDELTFAISRGNEQEAISLAICFDDDPDAINALSQDGKSYLHFAIEQGMRDLAMFLVMNGAKLDIENKDGQSAEELLKTLGEDDLLTSLKALGDGLEDDVDYSSWSESHPLYEYQDVFEKYNEGLEKRYLNQGQLDFFESSKQIRNEIVSIKGDQPFKDSLDILKDRQKKLGKNLFFDTDREKYKKMWVSKTLKGRLEERDEEGKTALIHAIEEHDSERLKFVLDMRVNIDQTDDEGHPPLYHAVLHENYNAIEEILKNKGSKKVFMAKGVTPIVYAAKMDKEELFNFLMDKDFFISKKKELILCYKLSKKLEREKWIKKMAQILGPKAVPQKNISKNQDNLEQGEVSFTNSKDKLFYAGENSDLELAKEAMDEGALINDRDRNGETVILKAAKKGSSELLEYLVSEGAKINYKTPDGRGPLICAIMGGNHDGVKYFLGKGGNLNTRYKGFTPLMMAAVMGSLPIVKELVLKGADTKVKTIKGVDAKNMARSKGHKEVAEYLRKL
jgi:serine/threonine-protein phosphatase 6 regulatory ankyrin repeat subunit B